MPASPAMLRLRDALEQRQIPLYFAVTLLAAALALAAPALTRYAEAAITPLLALMLYVTFLQLPIVELPRATCQVRFLAALALANFIFVPALVAGLLLLLPTEPMLKLGVLFVLLCPCIDYVVTFAQLGRADARLLLAATPLLLLAQILLLPLYLRLLLQTPTAERLPTGPFLHAFVWLILTPLALAALTQAWAARHKTGARVTTVLGLLPVPATALVLGAVFASVLPWLLKQPALFVKVLPVYLLFALLAPALGWLSARLLRLPPAAGRAVAFSSGTRNSLLVLPLALAVPEAIPVLPTVIISQTLVELAAELIYIRCLARLGSAPRAS